MLARTVLLPSAVLPIPGDTNFIDVAAAVLSIEDIECGKLDEIDATGYNLPVFIAINKDQIVPSEYLCLIQAGV